MISRRIVALGTLFTLLLVILCMAAATPLRTNVSSRNFEFTYQMTIPASPADAKILRIWIPLPQSDPYQAIGGLNPVDTAVAYKGPASNYGTANDPMIGEKIGGVNVFGGGLGLYASGDKLIGAVGVSGDTSCADHYVAWYLRKNLGLDHLGSISGVSGDPTRPDNIVYDIPATGATNTQGVVGVSAGGFGHPLCLNAKTTDPAGLPAVQP